jgi:ribosome-associated protein
MQEISISTEMIKLDQFLKWSGAADSGSIAKEMILSGKIKVNGETALQRGKKLHRGDKILVDEIDEFIIV